MLITLSRCLVGHSCVYMRVTRVVMNFSCLAIDNMVLEMCIRDLTLCGDEVDILCRVFYIRRGGPGIYK
jgi:hypothetical protein